jgi:hypothetical protein
MYIMNHCDFFGGVDLVYLQTNETRTGGLPGRIGLHSPSGTKQVGLVMAEACRLAVANEESHADQATGYRPEGRR